ncbi:M3 family oligoendopeptidase [Paenibacillus glycanilyticus]|uniref:M3 family oligoendopeptidase n=1 Tax=Paenibacillus glycanilyticus TaxID=126569 RepID=UPI0019101CD9|nr:M3 family oligoendopeptidase [Paenibacillus glycanilyticus]
MATSNYPMKWDLETFYEGGSGSAAFASELAGIEKDVAELDRLLSDSSLGTKKKVEDTTAILQSVLIRLRQSESFVECLQAQNMKDSAASGLSDRVKTISAKLLGALTRYDNELRQIGDEEWAAISSDGSLGEVAFSLSERRELAKEKLAPELEALAGDLAVDGYHGWGALYDLIVSRAKFTDIGENGEEKILSAGQMFNRLSDGDRSVRIRAFAEWEREWGDAAELCADALNRLAGFRLKLYGKRGWDSVLKEPLQINRMSEATFNAMWSAINEGKPKLVRYLERKAKLLGLEKLDWHDVSAPLGSSARTISFDEGAKFIVEQFRKFSPDMADFSEVAFRDAWIEAEDRAGKRPGGFCTSFPKSRQTRIFMTYSGTADNVSTLAHELGHAYHQYVMDDLPALSQEYAMNVAETASTFAELIVSDSAMKSAVDREEKLGLLEDKIQNAVAFFMNIHARVLFETRFYEERKQGIVPVEKLNSLMEEAQREAFSGALGELHPHFWASKLHFYITSVPFYNFPYTFGYLFSAGIYARALQEGPAFAERYVQLLRDTGRMTVEDLAKKHLGVNLEEADFWREAVELTTKDIDLFLELTE